MWTAQAYGKTWTAKTFNQLLNKIDDYGELHGLRAVSVVATKG